MANKTIEEVHDLLNKFHDGASVGKLVIHKSPDKHYIVQHESTVKLRELKPEEREFLMEFMEDWDALRVEVIGREGGPADRVNIIRIFT